MWPKFINSEESCICPLNVYGFWQGCLIPINITNETVCLHDINASMNGTLVHFRCFAHYNMSGTNYGFISLIATYRIIIVDGKFNLHSLGVYKCPFVCLSVCLSVSVFLLHRAS